MPKAGIQFSQKDEWYTPKKIVDFFGPFDYDPATTKNRADYLSIAKYDTIDTDGLNSDWSKFDKIWINPPFTKKFEFLEKAVSCGSNAFVLFPIESMVTKRFRDIVNRGGYIMWLPNGRIRFEDNDGLSSSPAFGSVVLEFGPKIKKRSIKNWVI